MNADRQAVAYHQNRWIAQREAVAEQLLQCCVKMSSGSLVFPRECAAFEHINVMTRLMGLILAALAVEVMADGLGKLFPLLRG